MGRALSRRAVLGAGVAALAAGAPDAAERLGVMCQFEPEETAARRVLDAAAQAGFRQVQVFFNWLRTTDEFTRKAPRWIAAAGLRCPVLGAYINCVEPANVLMNVGYAEFHRILNQAPEYGASMLVAWTGGYGSGLMKSDPRNFTPAAEDALVRFVSQYVKPLEESRLSLALETYITLTCPDAPSLRRVLDRLPPCVTAVLDPPNLTPIARYGERDRALLEMTRLLAGRIGVVHLKDFRLAPGGQAYELPGPLEGEMNYPLFVEQIQLLPPEIPAIAEHLKPAEFAGARQKLLPLFRAGRAV
jgi:sugar phosphate isomerase/epimerase